jgi:hypothetical protein
MIDNTERCQRLNLLWEEDGVLHMTFRLWEKADDTTVRAFAASLLEALVGGQALPDERQRFAGIAERSPRRTSCPGRAEN